MAEECVCSRIFCGRSVSARETSASRRTEEPQKAAEGHRNGQLLRHEPRASPQRHRGTEELQLQELFSKAFAVAVPLCLCASVVQGVAVDVSAFLCGLLRFPRPGAMHSNAYDMLSFRLTPLTNASCVAARSSPQMTMSAMMP